MGTLNLRHGPKATVGFLVLTLMTRLAFVVAFLSLVAQNVEVDLANLQHSPELPIGIVPVDDTNAFSSPQGTTDVHEESSTHQIPLESDHDVIVRTIQSAVVLETPVPPRQDEEVNAEATPKPTQPSQEATQPGNIPEKDETETPTSIDLELGVNVEGLTVTELLDEREPNVEGENSGLDSFAQEKEETRDAAQGNQIDGGTSMDSVSTTSESQHQEIREVDFLLEGEEEEVVLPNTTMLEDNKLLEGVGDPAPLATVLEEKKENDLAPQRASPEFNQSDDSPHDDIPSFSEWTQKVLAEAEKGVNNGSSATASTVKVTPAPKLRQKNYASPDCGAKVLAANPEAQHVSAVLDPSADEYFLSACTARIFFVLELCEAIQARKIEMANYELFSSSPKEFRVSISDRYPSRDWAVLGTFVASDQRSLQSFTGEQDHFGKFVKVELLSHYGTEHYCPISLFRVYGTSEYEVLNHEEDLPRYSEDADEEEMLENGKADTETKNLFGSAKDAVLSIVKKAAEVLVKSHQSSNQTEPDLEEHVRLEASVPATCLSLSYVPICPNCSSDLLNQVTQVLQCQEKLLVQLSRTFQQCPVHQSIVKARFMQVVFGKHVLLAFCNFVGYQPETVTSAPRAIQDASENVTQNQIPEGIVEENKDGITVTHPPAFVQERNLEAPPPTLIPTSTAPLISEPTLVTVNSGEVTKMAPVNVSDMSLDRLLSEVADLVAGSELASGTTVAPPTEAPPLEDIKGINLASVSSGGQKESVFVRLSNRIKALERNMSLSSQYLEELSRRYKRQVDDMQKTLNRTMLTLDETLKRMGEQEEHHTSTNLVLQKQLEAVVLHLTALEEEKESLRWLVFQGHAILAALELVAVCLVCWVCFQKVKGITAASPKISWQTPQPSPDKIVERTLLGERSRVENVLKNGVDISLVDNTSLLSVTLPSLPLGDCVDSSPSPSLASSCDSAFSNHKGSRETSPSRELLSDTWHKQHRRKRREGKRSLPTLMSSEDLEQLTGTAKGGLGMKKSPSFANGETHNVFSKKRIAPMGSRGKLKSDNWEWHAKLSQKSPEIDMGLVIGGSSLIVGR